MNITRHCSAALLTYPDAGQLQLASRSFFVAKPLQRCGQRRKNCSKRQCSRCQLPTTHLSPSGVRLLDFGVGSDLITHVFEAEAKPECTNERWQTGFTDRVSAEQATTGQAPRAAAAAATPKEAGTGPPAAGTAVKAFERKVVPPRPALRYSLAASLVSAEKQSAQLKLLQAWQQHQRGNATQGYPYSEQ